jgi:alpha-beta hydrolase superfamily lysophospholipase
VATAATARYAVEREIEDLDALITHAGGSAALYGSSSGGNLALEAAAQGLAVTKLAVWEPNLLVDDSRAPLPDDYVAQLEERVSAGRRGEAVEYFMTTAIGLPAEYLRPMRDSPMWTGMEQVAHTLAYDGRIVDGFRLHADRVAAVDAAAMIMDGGQTTWMSKGAEALAEALPHGVHRRLEGQEHRTVPRRHRPGADRVLRGRLMCKVMGNPFSERDSMGIEPRTHGPER